MILSVIIKNRLYNQILNLEQQLFFNKCQFITSCDAYVIGVITHLLHKIQDLQNKWKNPSKYVKINTFCIFILHHMLNTIS